MPLLAAAVLLVAAPRPAAQSADCLPEPTLRCVTGAAAAAVERAWSDPRNRHFLTASLVLLAPAQQKAGDTAGVARTVALVREAEARAGDSLPLAVFLVRHYPGEEGRAMMLRLVAKADQDRARHAQPEATPDFLFKDPILALAEAGMGAEAAALIARHRAASDAKVADLPPPKQLGYFLDLVAAYGAVGDKAKRAAAAARAWASAQAVEGDRGHKLRLRAELAKAMLDAGAIAEARAVAADARRQFSDSPDFSILAFEIAAASGDAQARATEIAAMREARRRVIGNPGDWQRGETHHQLEALMRAGERAEARSVFAEAKAALATITVRDGDWSPFLALAMLAAAAGDEAEADAMVKRLEAIRDPRDTDASHAERLRALLVETCRAYARHGHAPPALRCVARVGESGNMLAHATRARIDLAAVMAKAAR